MMIKKLSLIVFMLLGILSFALAQSKVSGKIGDAKGAPLVGASVVEKGTTNGIVTDLDGNFSLTVKQGAALQVSMVGYETQDIAIGNQSVINISLAEGTTLSELIVTALVINNKY